jgi:polyphosphate kinase 2 (PPK2 family)
MLDQIDLDQTIDHREYKTRIADLQARLYAMEQELFESRVPAIFVFEGWAGAAKVRTIQALTHRLDPRGVRVHPITPPRTSEAAFPWLHRFWLKTPSYGQIAIFDRSWYRQVIAERSKNAPAEAGRDRCEDIVAFERMLADDGATILKFWLHISKDEQKRRFAKLLADPLTAWQVTDDDRWQQRHYKRVRDAVEFVLTRTDTPHAPWVVVPANSKHYARITVLESILAALEARLGQSTPPSAPPEELVDAGGTALRRTIAAVRNGNGAALPPRPNQLPAVAVNAVAEDEAPTPPAILRRVDLSLRLDARLYERKLKRLQARLHLLGLRAYQGKRPVVLVFEGWDAAGKGGAIQRVTEQLDPRSYTVHAIAAPSGDDKAHHYLYRFWRRLPPAGQFAIFDRSWYGRVLVERIEGFARPDEWQRAYAEINDFERQLVEFGTIICKFWLHITPDEQLRRFEERQNTPYKAWKLTDEDWRNREKWPQYEHAADEMLLRTATPAAPWTIIESEDKRYGRIKVLRTLVKRLEAELGKVEI